jgi:hypothetical protein
MNLHKWDVPCDDYGMSQKYAEGCTTFVLCRYERDIPWTHRGMSHEMAAG